MKVMICSKWEEDVIWDVYHSKTPVIIRDFLFVSVNPDVILKDVPVLFCSVSGLLADAQMHDPGENMYLCLFIW